MILFSISSACLTYSLKYSFQEKVIDPTQPLKTSILPYTDPGVIFAALMAYSFQLVCFSILVGQIFARSIP